MPKEPIFITVEYTPFGALSLSTIHKWQRVQMAYYSYGEAQAKKLFKQHLKTLK